MRGGLIERMKENNNLFWEDVREYFLDDFLDGVYRDPKKTKRIQKWLNRKHGATLVIHQIDARFPSDLISDSLKIEFHPDGFEVDIVDKGDVAQVDIELYATHMGLVTGTASFGSFISAYFAGEIKPKKILRRLRDYYHVAKIFFS